jgi:hypothetical protein
MKNTSNPKYPLKPGTEEFDKMYPNPLRTAYLCIAGGLLGIVMAECNIIPPVLGYFIGLGCGIKGLPHSLAAVRLALY